MGTQQSTQATSLPKRKSPPTGRYVICQGSGVLRDQHAIPVRAGRRAYWTLCAFCQIRAYYTPMNWSGSSGFTREEMETMEIPIVE